MLHRQEASGPAHARLHLVGDQQDSVFAGELAKARQEVFRRDEVAALALDGFDEDRGHAVGGRDSGEELFDSGDGLVGRHSAGGRRVRRVKYRRQKRCEPTALTGFGGGEREGAERPSVKATDEGDVARPPRGIARQLHSALDRFSPRVGEEHLGRRAWQDLGLEALGQLDLRPVVEVGPRHMEEPPRLLFDRGHHAWM